MKKEFDVKGMHCKSCELIIKDSIADLNGVKSVSASSATGKVKVDFDEKQTSESIIKSIILKEGYKVLK